VGWRGVSRSGDGRCSPSTTMLRSLKDEYLLFLYTVGQSHVDTPLFLLLFFFLHFLNISSGEQRFMFSGSE